MKNVFFTALMLLTLSTVFTACSDNAKKSTTEQLAKDETYTCTMHNEVMSDHKGDCPKCGMKLTKERMTEEQMQMMKEGTYVKPKE